METKTVREDIFTTLQTLMAPIGYLSGYKMVREIMENELLKMFVISMLRNEIIPAFQSSDDDGLVMQITNRYADSSTCLSLVAGPNLISGFSNRVVPCLVNSYDRKGRLPLKLVFSFSSLILCCAKRLPQKMARNKNTEIIELMVRLWPAEHETAGRYHALVSILLGCKKYWQRDLNQVPGLTDAITHCLMNMGNIGFDYHLKEVTKIA